MTARERILKALEGGRLLRSRDLQVAADCHAVQIARIVKEDDSPVFQFAGAYVLAGTPLDFDEALVEAALRFPRGVLSLWGAARFWSLTEDVSRETAHDTILVSAGDWTRSTIPGVDVLSTRNKASLETGIVSVDVAPGVTLQVTNAARTVCDLFAARARDATIPTEWFFGVVGNAISRDGDRKLVDDAMRICDCLGRDARGLNDVLIAAYQAVASRQATIGGFGNGPR